MVDDAHLHGRRFGRGHDPHGRTERAEAGGAGDEVPEDLLDVALDPSHGRQVVREPRRELHIRKALCLGPSESRQEALEEHGCSAEIEGLVEPGQDQEILHHPMRRSASLATVRAASRRVPSEIVGSTINCAPP